MSSRLERRFSIRLESPSQEISRYGLWKYPSQPDQELHHERKQIIGLLSFDPLDDVLCGHGFGDLERSGYAIICHPLGRNKTRMERNELDVLFSQFEPAGIHQYPRRRFCRRIGSLHRQPEKASQRIRVCYQPMSLLLHLLDQWDQIVDHREIVQGHVLPDFIHRTAIHIEGRALSYVQQCHVDVSKLLHGGVDYGFCG